METGAQRDERTERYPTVRNYSIIEKSRMIWNWIVDAVLRHALYSLSTGPLPRHIAFIMDGNRRWSRSHGMPVQEGHAKGFETLKRILELCLSLQRIEVVTVYAFAIDNFKRKASEVDALMELARTRLIELYQESEFVARHSIRIRIAGHREYLPPSVQETARRAEEETCHNTGPILNICFPYSAQAEICYAAQKAAKAGEPIIPDTVASNLMVPANIPVDILVRTSHVSRLSDFLLWQVNEHTQMHFIKQYWPTFGTYDLLSILLEYQRAHM